MSIEHMRTANTLPRNLQMCFLVESGESIGVIAKSWGVKPSSVRSSVQRTKGHISRFISKYPDVLGGEDPRRAAFRAFAAHVGVKLRYGRAKTGQQELF